MRVVFIGAGPGDPELLTIKGKKIIEEADIIIYAGSLVNPKILSCARPGIPTHNSAGMDLEDVTNIYRREKDRRGIIARLHTGDPSLYGAIQEQIDFCRTEGIPTEVIPGVSSFFAAAASLQQEFTLPGISQSLVLTRMAGRTPVPESEEIAEFSRHRSSMAIFLSVGNIKELVQRLLTGYSAETPAAVVYRASWPDEKIVTGTLTDIAEKTEAAGISRQALVLVGEVLRSREEDGFYKKSKLYDPDFTHGYRQGKASGGERRRDR